MINQIIKMNQILKKILVFFIKKMTKKNFYKIGDDKI